MSAVSFKGVGLVFRTLELETSKNDFAIKANLKTNEGCGAHAIKKTRFQLAAVLSTMANPIPGSVWSGTEAAVREQHNNDFCQKSGFGARLSTNIVLHYKHYPIDVALCLDSDAIYRAENSLEPAPCLK